MSNAELKYLKRMIRWRAASAIRTARKYEHFQDQSFTRDWWIRAEEAWSAVWFLQARPFKAHDPIHQLLSWKVYPSLAPYPDVRRPRIRFVSVRFQSQEAYEKLYQLDKQRAEARQEVAA